MLGIIGAMQIETDGLIEKLENRTDRHIGSLQFFKGKLYGRETVVCRCGIGKVNSATAAAILILYFDVSLIINIGIAGGVMPGIKQGDIVIASASVQHDYDASAGSKIKKGQIAEYNFVEFVSDPAAVKLMQDVIKKAGHRFYTGTIATGDQFIADKAKAVSFYSEFNAFACDMETAAIAHVCHILHKKFLAMRAISDNADGSAVEDLNSFAEKAAERSIDAVTKFISAYVN